MSAPEQTAVQRLADLDARIHAGEQVPAGEYVEAEAAARIEVRAEQAVDRIEAEKEAENLKTLRRNKIEQVKGVVPVAVSSIHRKVADAIAALDAEVETSRLLYPAGLRALTADVATLSARVLAAVEAGGAPNGTAPSRDLLAHVYAVRDEVTVPWSDYLDLSDELAAIESVVRPVAAEF